METKLSNEVQAELKLIRKYEFEKEKVDAYLEKHDIEMDITGGNIYIRTSHGCWKLIPSETNNNLYLMHRNHTYEKVTLEDAKKGGYHKQFDHYSGKTVLEHLKYIKNHDQYVATGVSAYDDKNFARDSKKAKTKYKANKKKVRMNEVNRVMDLFAVLEMA